VTGLLVALLAFLVASFLLTPLSGLETRPPSQVKPLGAISLGVFFVGVFLAIASLVLVIRGQGPASALAIIAAVLFLPGFVADRTGNLSKLPTPAAIFWIEWAEAVIAVAVIVLAIRA
jgi:hypothetical protein